MICQIKKQTGKLESRVMAHRKKIGSYGKGKKISSQFVKQCSARKF